MGRTKPTTHTLHNRRQRTAGGDARRGRFSDGGKNREVAQGPSKSRLCFETICTTNLDTIVNCSLQLLY